MPDLVRAFLNPTLNSSPNLKTNPTLNSNPKQLDEERLGFLRSVDAAK